MTALDLVLPTPRKLELSSVELALPPEGRVNLVTVEQLGADGVGLRLHAWAADPLARRTLASDLRAAVLVRLRDDGVLGGAREANGAG